MLIDTDYLPIFFIHHDSIFLYSNLLKYHALQKKPIYKEYFKSAAPAKKRKSVLPEHY